MKPYAGSDFQEQRGFTNKDREHRIVRGFLRRLGFSEFHVTLTERPDALVDFRDARGSVRIGCEIQSLQADIGESGSQLREFESRWIRVTERVLATLDADGKPVPYCTVKFSIPSYDFFRHVRDDDLIKEFILVGRHLRGATSIAFPQQDTPTLNHLLAEIRVIDSDGQGRLWWPTHLKSGYLVPLDDQIVKAINRKADVAASFDWRESDDRWLLLVAEARGLTDVIGGAQKIDLPAESYIPFTRVLVWDLFSEDIWAMFPDYAIICDGNKQARKPSLLPERVRRFCTQGESYPTKPNAR